MTDRVSSFLVTLEQNRREDDAEAILNALRMVKGVIAVEPVKADVATQVAEARVSRQLRDRLWKVIEGNES